MSRTNLALVERSRNLRIEAQTKAREEAAEVERGVAETIGLSRARGDEIVTPQQGRGERTKPARKVVGLDWLKARGKIDGRQYMAGDKYGARVQAASHL